VVVQHGEDRRLEAPRRGEAWDLCDSEAARGGCVAGALSQKMPLVDDKRNQSLGRRPQELTRAATRTGGQPRLEALQRLHRPEQVQGFR